MIPAEKQRNGGRLEDLPSLIELKKKLVAHSQEVRGRNETAQQRLSLLSTMSRAFANTMRATIAERRRFTEERERLLERERMAHAEAEASRKQLRNVLESIGDAFSALDGQWCYTYANDRMIELADRPRSELLGRTIWGVFPELSEDPTRAELLRAAEEGVVTQFENYSPRLRRWLRHRVYPSPAGLSIYTTDITEHRKAEEERDLLLSREWMARAETEERRRISRELHDRVAHSMGVVHQSLELYEALKESDPSQAEAKMKLAKETAREALDLTRNLAKELRSSEVEDGLSSALSNLLKTSVPPDLEYDVSVEGDESLIPPTAREQLFQILREGVRNVVSHSDAHCLRVGVKIEPEEVVGSVEDDGRGFAEASGSGSGTRSMRERTELMGGTFLLSSAPDGGTRIRASVPLKADSAKGKARPSNGG